MKNTMNRLLLAASLLLCGCAGNDDAVATMQRAGFKDVVVTDSSYVGVAFQGCSKDDNAVFDVTATNPAGQRITATVCCGSWKKCTIRY